jgi:chromosome segregation ATPase
LVMGRPGTVGFCKIASRPNGDCATLSRVWGVTVLASKNLIQLLIRPKTDAVPMPTVEDKVDALMLDDGQESAGAPLQTLSAAIQKAAAELSQVEDIRRKLESLRAPIAAEFENRVADSSRLAQLTSELRTTRSRLTESETGQQRAAERLRDLDQQVLDLSGQLDRSRVSLAATTDGLERLKPEHQEALAQIDELRTQVITYSGQVFDLQTDKESINHQLEVSESARANVEALLARTREVGAEMEARAEGALKRLEQASSENIGLERIISELKVISAGEQERAAELATQLAASRAEARLANEAMKQASEVNRTEIKELRAKLDEALSRAKRLQKLHNELSDGQAATLDEKSKLQRDLAAIQAENRQMTQRIEVLENWLADWRRRFGDVDAARLASVDRAEQLQVALAQSEAAMKRAEATAEQKSNELVEAFRAAEAEQTRLRAEIAELKSLLSQGRAELKMMRPNVASKG